VWFVVATLPAVVGVALCVYFVFELKREIDDMERLRVPGEVELYLPAGDYVLYSEGKEAFSIQCAVVDDATGEEVPLEVDTGTTITVLDQSLRSVFEMSIPREGSYRVMCEGDPVTIAISDGLGGEIAGAVVSALAGFILMGGAMALVARSRQKRRQPPPLWAVAP
jgi:hypothetical protein